VTKKNITKIEITKILSQKTGLSSLYSKKILNDLIQIIIKQVKDNNLILKNIGTFRIISKNERIGRNPKTKEQFLIKKRKSISFISSKNLRKIINQRNG
tara:strand:- start:321 stop:617 length:297 start_codon:yes stop_codon:yes gene_type:complete